MAIMGASSSFSQWYCGYLRNKSFLAILAYQRALEDHESEQDKNKVAHQTIGWV